MIDINDVSVGDEIGHAQLPFMVPVTRVDLSTGTVTLNGQQGVSFSFTIDKLSADGFFHRKVPAAGPIPPVPAMAPAQQQANAGILGWLPIQQQPQQFQPNQQQFKPNGHWFFRGGYQIVAKADSADAEPLKKTRKQVSHNGKDWCDYRLLLDADDFESYEYRREI